MNWSDVFPILTDELIDDYATRAPAKFKRDAAGWFEEKRTINPRPVKHIISVSLFWKNIWSHQPDIVIKDREWFMTAGQRKVLRFEPWSHYVRPLLEGAYALQLSNREDVAFRVYLAAELEFLVPDLVEAGCEVRLMQSSSIRHNPGAMWRFLALADTDKLITIVDSDRASMPFLDVARTEAMAAAGLNWWRVPVWGELNEIGNVSYRPFLALQFGSSGGLTEIRTMMEALVWNVQVQQIETFAKLPGCAPKPVHGTVWPDYGFDEWFLLCGVYPRAAYDGVLTFVPSDAHSRLLPMDVQYASKANDRSEIHYFGSPGAGCCSPLASGLPTPVPGKVRVRPDCAVLIGSATARTKIRKAPLVFEEPKLVTFNLKGELMEALQLISRADQTEWLAVIADGIVPGPGGAEVFTDRCLDRCDVAHTGYAFTFITPEIEAWAKRKKLPADRWKAGQPLKHPRLSGPLTLWKRTFLAKQLKAWAVYREAMSFEIWIAVEVAMGSAVPVDTSPQKQGWQILGLPSLLSISQEPLHDS